MPKLCIIGAGSTEFTKRIVTDLLLMNEFKSIEISLMDIDVERLKVSEIIIKAIAEQLNSNPKVNIIGNILYASTFEGEAVWSHK